MRGNLWLSRRVDQGVGCTEESQGQVWALIRKGSGGCHGQKVSDIHHVVHIRCIHHILCGYLILSSMGYVDWGDIRGGHLYLVVGWLEVAEEISHVCQGLY